MRTIVSFALLVLVLSKVQGATISETLDPALFGNLDRDSGRGSAPVSFTNSLVYLQNAFPEIYGVKGLVDYTGEVPTQSELASVADILAGPDYMDWEERWDSCYLCLQEPGLSYAEVLNGAISGHMSYIEERVPGSTRWEVWDWEEEPSFMAAIADDIRLGKIPHVMVFDAASGTLGRAFLPITGIEYDEGSDFGSITYIDPLDGSIQTSSVSILPSIGYQIHFSEFSTVARFASVSPVPEPATWALAAMGAAGCFLARRKRIKHDHTKLS